MASSSATPIINRSLATAMTNVYGISQAEELLWAKSDLCYSSLTMDTLKIPEGELHSCSHISLVIINRFFSAKCCCETPVKITYTLEKNTYITDLMHWFILRCGILGILLNHTNYTDIFSKPNSQTGCVFDLWPDHTKDLKRMWPIASLLVT